MSDIVRVLRIIEYVGPRHDVEEVISHSIHGIMEFTRHAGGVITIRAATIGVPEVLIREEENPSGYRRNQGS